MEKKQTPRRRPRDENAQKTVAFILDATERVMAGEGYAKINTNKIARVAGVSVGTLYHYFPSKEALVEAVMKRGWEEELGTLFMGARDVERLSLDEAIRELCRRVCKSVMRRRMILERWRNEVPHLSTPVARSELKELAISVIVAAFDLRKDELRFPPEQHMFAARFVVFAVLPYLRELASFDSPTFDRGDHAAYIGDILVRYIVRDDCLGKVRT